MSKPTCENYIPLFLYFTLPFGWPLPGKWKSGEQTEHGEHKPDPENIPENRL